jgi:hypothetical protein
VKSGILPNRNWRASDRILLPLKYLRDEKKHLKINMKGY